MSRYSKRCWYGERCTNRYCTYLHHGNDDQSYHNNESYGYGRGKGKKRMKSSMMQFQEVFESLLNDGHHTSWWGRKDNFPTQQSAQTKELSLREIERSNRTKGEKEKKESEENKEMQQVPGKSSLADKDVEIKKLRVTNNHLKRVGRRYRSLFHEKNKTSKSLTKQLDQIKVENDALRKEKEDFTQRIADKEARAQVVLANAKQIILKVENENRRLRSEIQKLTKSDDDLERKREKTTEDSKEKENQLHTLEVNLIDKEKLTSDLQSAHDRVLSHHLQEREPDLVRTFSKELEETRDNRDQKDQADDVNNDDDDIEMDISTREVEMSQAKMAEKVSDIDSQLDQRANFDFYY